MKRIVFAIALLCYSFLWCQNKPQLDSLKTELNRATNDSVEYAVLNALIRNYITINLDSTRVYNDLLIKLSETTDQEKVSIDGFNLASAYYYYNGQLDSSLYFVKRSLEAIKDTSDYRTRADLYRKLAILSRTNSQFEDYEKYGLLASKMALKSGDIELYALTLVVNGNRHFNQNDYSNALKYYLQIDSVLTKHEKLNSTLNLAYENIALIYIALKSKDALIYLDKSEEVHKALESESGINNVNRIRASYYSGLSDWENAVRYLKKVVPYYESLGEPNKLVEVYTGLTRGLTAMGNLDDAEVYLTKSSEVIKRPGFNNTFSMNQVHYSAGLFYLEKKAFQKAVEHFKEAEKSAVPKGTDYFLGERVEINEGLSRAYAGLADYEKAHVVGQRLLILKDSLNEQNKEKLTKELEKKYQTEKQEQQIELLTTQNELSEQQKTNQRNLFMAGGSVLALSFIGLFFLYRNKQKTNKKLRELDSMKSNFFANISHEFRTPLTLISGPIQEKLENQKTPKKDREAFEMMQRNNNRLLGLVDQLLDLSKIDAGKLNLRISHGNLKSILGTLVDSFSYRAQQKKVSFTSSIQDALSEAWFDKDMMEKIVINLLSNAFKYVPDEGTVTLNAIRDEKNQLILEVTNSVDGQTNLNLDNFFDRFYQGDPQAEGAGIGLALVNELVSLHKGVINITQEGNGNIKFTITLPINSAVFDSEEIQNTPQQSSVSVVDNTYTTEAEDIDLETLDEKPLLLVVEDNPDVQLLLKNTFKNDFNVLGAPNGEVGIAEAVEHVPDIVISDVMMPIMDGISLTETLKNDERTSHIPIVLLTAKAGEENVLKGIESGADDYMVKPFSGKILRSKINKLVSLRKKLQERYSQEVILKPADIAINSVDEQFLNRVQEVMDSSIVESSFNTEEFSKAVGMSRMQLHRKLKALTGLSASEFIRSQRLKLAADLLQKSDINVSQVGYSVGFNDHSYFSKCFKETYGKTPSDYAKKG